MAYDARNCLVSVQDNLGRGGSIPLSIAAGVESKAVRKQDFKHVTVDTTVQEKAITYPTDAKWLERSRQCLVRLCKQHDVGCMPAPGSIGGYIGR